ncbi:MAG: hypothetical protein KAQ79_23515 [Cyclobacteriaceae bacterium]|nr:hypothetical protein [Cyclobacteriaceae bacterium]
MKFKINFKPYPGAPYFTVQEHVRSFNPKTLKISDEYLDQAEKCLRGLFNISSEFRFEIYEKHELGKLLTQMEKLIVKDDPETGVDFMIENKHEKDQTTLFDLSYSFPHVQHDISNYNMILIDPRASLGIPIGYILVFSKTKSFDVSNVNEDLKNPDFIRDIFILHKVLGDYLERGIDVLLRESNYKAAVLNQMIENCHYLNFVTDNKYRSKTMITAECNLKFLEEIDKMGYVFRTQRISQKFMITIANYPTHSKELVEMLSDRVATI